MPIEVAMHLLGSTGPKAGMLFVGTHQRVPRRSSSLTAYDNYRTYVNPKTDGKRVFLVVIVVYCALTGGLSAALHGIRFFGLGLPTRARRGQARHKDHPVPKRGPACVVRGAVVFPSELYVKQSTEQEVTDSGEEEEEEEDETTDEAAKGDEPKLEEVDKEKEKEEKKRKTKKVIKGGGARVGSVEREQAPVDVRGDVPDDLRGDALHVLVVDPQAAIDLDGLPPRGDVLDDSPGDALQLPVVDPRAAVDLDRLPGVDLQAAGDYVRLSGRSDEGGAERHLLEYITAVTLPPFLVILKPPSILTAYSREAVFSMIVQAMPFYLPVVDLQAAGGYARLFRSKR